jgi:hypothetical protein
MIGCDSCGNWFHCKGKSELEALKKSRIILLKRMEELEKKLEEKEFENSVLTHKNKVLFEKLTAIETSNCKMVTEIKELKEEVDKSQKDIRDLKRAHRLEKLNLRRQIVVSYTTPNNVSSVKNPRPRPKPISITRNRYQPVLLAGKLSKRFVPTSAPDKTESEEKLFAEASARKIYYRLLSSIILTFLLCSIGLLIAFEYRPELFGDVYAEKYDKQKSIILGFLNDGINKLTNFLK